MKHVFLMLVLTLVGCSTQDSNNNDVKQNNTDKMEENKTIEKDTETKKYINNPQAPDDRALTKIGKTVEDEDGELTLKALNEVGKTYGTGPIKLTIEKVKVLNYYPSPDLIDFFHKYSKNETNFNYVLISISVKNTADKTVNFAPVSTLKTNQGEKKDFEDDFYLENMYGNYQSGEKRVGNLGFVLDETAVENLDWIKIRTSSPVDKNNKKLSGEVEAKIIFK